MKHVGISAVAIAAAALLFVPASAQEAGKAGGAGAGGAAAGGAAAGGGAAGGAGRVLPDGGAGQASPGMKPAEGAQPEPGARKNGENVGVSPDQPPKAPAEPAQNKAEGQNRPAAKPGAAEPAGKAQPGEAGQKGNPEAAGKPKGEGEADNKPNGTPRPAPKITTVQRTKIQETIREVHVAPVRVDFRIGIGVAVPRTVVLNPLPPAIITLVPGYEGFRFFVVPGQIVIVDPISLAIVAVLPL